ncbi:MAG TPA: phosphoenolpyruvate--protein phosphotransferase [Ignavibacteria bacterium]|nr:phosphoenolpyruvate--protein phosphotransferase [Bacteroidota bacterium]HRI85570.1 phosphoenolpyruvate--protein phosphotransferase [Ignavibacteria bacterium]HRK00596.1 phosphoenolpyruvate--protein phosphotransferase [Ignavibacteria bacterium]
MDKDITFKGVPVSPGISVGEVYLYVRNNFEINSRDLIPEDIEKEISDFKRSIEISAKELSKIRNYSYEKIGEVNSLIFDAQLEFLQDKFFLSQIIHRIQNEKRTADFIFNDEITKLEHALLASRDSYLKERFEDIKDIKNRVIRNMKREKLVSKIEENQIIISHELTPADTILFSKRKVLGYATDKGGNTSHAAIISRALRIPAVVGMKDITKSLKTGDNIIIDGSAGIIIKNPSEKTLEAYREKIVLLKEYEDKLKEIIDLPCTTTDNKEIELTANIDFDEEIDFIVNTGHCGIGLYRTEHLFLEEGGFPSEEKQNAEYKHISDVVYPKNVTIRTYDIGGDKLLPRSEKEDNPFLGWRGIRICLDREDIFREQLCAVYKSSINKNIRILFPMITSVTEVRRIKEIIKEVKGELEKDGIEFDKNLKTGIMIEVPSAAILADELAAEVDFFSIGTNDLIQYLLAVDRGNDLVSNLYQEFHPAVIRTIRQITDAAHKNNIQISVCGEMASNPHAVMIFIGLGVDELSVSPSRYPEIKQIIRSISYKEAAGVCEEILKLSSETEIREKIKKFNRTILNENSVTRLL